MHGEVREQVRDVLTAGGLAVCAGAWTAAAELSPRRRRLARVGIGAVVIALPTPRHGGPSAVVAGTPPMPDEPPVTAWRVRLVAAGAALMLAADVGRRRLERRWLRRLARRGHPHPHRSLGRRTAALVFAAELAGRWSIGREGSVGRPGIDRTGRRGDACTRRWAHDRDG